VITELVPYELGATARLEFLPEGVRYQLDIPTKWLAAPANRFAKVDLEHEMAACGTKEIDPCA
jgi:hypothetical protein